MSVRYAGHSGVFPVSPYSPAMLRRLEAEERRKKLGEAVQPNRPSIYGYGPQEEVSPQQSLFDNASNIADIIDIVQGEPTGAELISDIDWSGTFGGVPTEGTVVLPGEASPVVQEGGAALLSESGAAEIANFSQQIAAAPATSAVGTSTVPGVTVSPVTTAPSGVPTQTITGLNTGAPASSSAAPSSTGGINWAGLGYAAIVAGIMKAGQEINAGQYGLGDIVTGNSFDIKYRDELNDVWGGLGDVASDVHSTLAQGGLEQRIMNKASDDLFGVNPNDFLGGILGGKSNQAGAATLDLRNRDSWEYGVGKSYSSKNVDALSSINDAMLAFGDVLGGSDTKLNLWLGRADGFRISDRDNNPLLETKNSGDALRFIADDIVKNATNLDEDTKQQLLGFDGSVEELFNYAVQLKGGSQ